MGWDGISIQNADGSVTPGTNGLSLFYVELRKPVSFM
jgi:hypothetical protein